MGVAGWLTVLLWTAPAGEAPPPAGRPVDLRGSADTNIGLPGQDDTRPGLPAQAGASINLSGGA
jgi:hypothetical protein